MIEISVVIPCRNEVKFINECITNIYDSEIGSDVKLNVFVVDGMSDDGTRDVIKELQLSYPTLALVDNVQRLTPFAFNLGIHATDYDFIQIVGARHIISENYISNCLLKLQSDSDVWCVGGRIINQYINFEGQIIAEVMGTTFGIGLGNFRTLEKSGFTDTVTSPMYPKAVFKKIGYFDEDLIRNQDDDFNFRVTKAGGKIFFDADISLKYYVRGSFPGLWKQFFQYGYWKVFVNRKHKAVTTFRQLIPPLFVSYLAVLPIIALFSWKLGLLATLPLLIYGMMAVFFSYKLMIKDSSLPFLKVFQTFVILHISYGLGYLRGILDFFILRKNPSDKQKELSR